MKVKLFEVVAPNFVELLITHTEPGVKGIQQLEQQNLLLLKQVQH